MDPIPWTTLSIVFVALLIYLSITLTRINSVFAAASDNARRLARLEQKLDRMLVAPPADDAPKPSAVGEEWTRSRASTALSDETAIGRLERKLDALLSHAGINYSDESGDPVRALLRAGNKIGAIKLYREQHPGVGLREAKEFVDAIQVEERIY